MTLRTALLLTSLAPVVALFAAVRSDRSWGKRLPPWITKGAADDIRWFLFEPGKKGARITRRNFESASHDGSYRLSANFFDRVIRNHDQALMRHLNLSVHEGHQEELWKTRTGKSLAELGAEWKEANRKRLGLRSSPS